LIEKFGERRVIDTPVSENAMTGAAVGAALAGMRAVVVHPRMDFMFYAFDPIINEAANWFYMSGGKASVPVVFWGVINRGGEQAAQHSQALHAMFSHAPGLKVVMPATPYDAKGLLVAAIKDDNPVVFVDDRWLYIPWGMFPRRCIRFRSERAIRKEGKDVSLIASSFMVGESMKAASELEKQDIDAEVLDLRTVKPLDVDMILKSVEKTGPRGDCRFRLENMRLAAEVSAIIAENDIRILKSPVRRITLPDILDRQPVPWKTGIMSSTEIVDAVRILIGEHA